MRGDFAVFIMVHGRPEKAWTYTSLKKQGYTGKIFLVADNLDETRNKYKEIYGDKLLIFDKKKAALKMDSGDNSLDFRSTLYSANTIFKLAKENNIKYFFIMCDDYTGFFYCFNNNYEFKRQKIKNLDKVFSGMLKFYKKTTISTIAMAQGGDFLGGNKGGNAKIKLMRKAMNTFLCSTERPFKFIGRLNEDVTTYVNLGSKGSLFITTTNLMITQKGHQQEKSGLTDVYLDSGTYVKSFFSVMYNPSSVKIADVSNKHKRIHHKVKWKYAVPKIINEKYKK
jgi:hypothetical protein